VPPLTEDPMSHQLKLCTWKELKEVYGIPFVQRTVVRHIPGGTREGRVLS
jgi:hypothetical protein